MTYAAAPATASAVTLRLHALTWRIALGALEPWRRFVQTRREPRFGAGPESALVTRFFLPHFPPASAAS